MIHDLLEKSCQTKTFDVVLTFALLFDVYFVSLFFFYRIRTKSFSACTFYKLFSVKDVKIEKQEFRRTDFGSRLLAAEGEGCV